MSEDERAYQTILKRRRQLRTTDHRALYQQLYGYLARRGFSPDTIERAWRRLKEEERLPAEEE
jgi:SOS response regulatory protein OraA/RecX